MGNRVIWSLDCEIEGNLQFNYPIPQLPNYPIPVAESLTFREVLRIDVMRRVWYAQVISLFGDFVALFAVISVVTYRMHGTPSQVTGIQIAYMLPVGVLGLLSGVFVDRWPLKPTLIVSDLLRAALVALLIFATTLWHLLLVVLPDACRSA